MQVTGTYAQTDEERAATLTYCTVVPDYQHCMGTDVVVFRDPWTPGPGGKTWQELGRARGSCSSDNGQNLNPWSWEVGCMAGTVVAGQIYILHMAPETVDLFNAAYGTQMPRGRYTITRFVGLFGHEYLHIDTGESEHPAWFVAEEATRMEAYLEVANNGQTTGVPVDQSEAP